jgi:AcrR family transcriptional regulator
VDPIEEPIRRGRRRSKAADQAILAAALWVLATDGYAGLTMGAVIERAGTSSATVYRRWPDKQQLVSAALASLTPDIPDVDTGTFDGDLAAFIADLTEFYCARPEDLGEHMIAELGRNPEFRVDVTERFVRPRIVVLGQIIDRAHRRGEIGHGVDAATAYSFVSGPIHHHVKVMGASPSPAFLRSVAAGSAAALRALAPLPADPPTP